MLAPKHLLLIYKLQFIYKLSQVFVASPLGFIYTIPFSPRLLLYILPYTSLSYAGCKRYYYM